MPSLRTLDGVDVEGKRVLLRADFNVPVENGKVADVTRIARAAPTILDIAARGGKVILLSHFGRPKGPDRKDSLKPLVPAIADVLGRPVAFGEDCIGEKARAAVNAMRPGDVLCLENTRFHQGEERNDPDFVAQLAALGDIFVNDAFSVSHRAHASVEGLGHRLPAYAGRDLAEEVEALDRVLETPAHPLAAIVGGAKVSSKLDLLGNLIAKANTFLAALGKPVGKSLCEHELTASARDILGRAKRERREIVLPIDVVVAHELKANAPSREVAVERVEEGEMILDIGRRSI